MSGRQAEIGSPTEGNGQATISSTTEPAYPTEPHMGPLVPTPTANSPDSGRFSADDGLARPTSSRRAAPAPPRLDTQSLDYGSRPGSASDARMGPSMPAQQVPAVTSPRARDRGYSLRRSLFARAIGARSEAEVPPIGNASIELQDGAGSLSSGSSGSRPGTAASGTSMGAAEGAHQSPRRLHARTTSADVGNLLPSTVLEESQSESGYVARSEEDVTISGKGEGNKKRAYASAGLQQQELWSTKQTRTDKFLEQVQKAFDEDVTQFLFREKALPPSQDGRHIPLEPTQNHSKLIDERTNNPYVPNTIRSSRYTIWSFLPRQLLFQFGKLANAYFLVLSILQMIPGLSTTGSYTTIVPLLAFVSVSMAREGYDDVKRYQLDKVENNKDTLVAEADAGALDQSEKKFKVSMPQWPSKKSKTGANNSLEIEGPWERRKWKDIRVGDVLKLRRDDDVPADMVLLHTNGMNGTAFIETMALDGETNLKMKQPPSFVAKSCTTEAETLASSAEIVVEDPNIDLYNFDGKMTFNGETFPLTTSEVMLRGSTLRNTPMALGMVINTGEECKIRMNANKRPRIKAPALQRETNKVVVMLLFYVLVLAFFCTAAYQIWSRQVENDSWYLDDGHVSFQYISIGFLILFNNLIPLSLYVSLEILKIGQMILMMDVEMYDPISNTPMACNTTTILENLGQVNYVFSDKTGTLTDNIMKFRKFSVAGYAFLHDSDLQKEAQARLEKEAEIAQKDKTKGKGIARRRSEKKKLKEAANQRVSADMPIIQPERPSLARHATNGSSASLWKSTARPMKGQHEARSEDLLEYMQRKPHSLFTKKARFFLLSMALCHTAQPENRDEGKTGFQASSPDELALVSAAEELGYLVVDRTTQSITVNGALGVETYTILDVIEFSSKRKRMSIVVRFPDGRICLLCKGADSAILPKLTLASLAQQKKDETSRRTSRRKSLEAEYALRRLSEHSPRNSFSKPSRPSLTMGRSSFNANRASMTSAKLRPVRDELNSWLKERENEVELFDEDTSAYHTPRASIAISRASFASTEPRASMQEEYYDSLIDESIVVDDATIFERCFQHTDDFASEGLRTLLYGYKFLDTKSYEAWKKVYLEATTSLVDRQELIEKAGDMIEQDFELAGATAIEDKLQIGVPDTIDKLRRANIKIWMLTGDKRETAINIAHSARLAKDYSQVIILDSKTGDVEEKMIATQIAIREGRIAHSVVVVDGQTLANIDENQDLAFIFFDLVIRADSVICCRASPSQKASLVQKVRTRVHKSMTLAIGDGANDIAMIQEAHVGIGLSGKEGLQAARTSDFSIAQFRFLQRLLLVHGRWNYVRTSKYVLSTFWKEMFFYTSTALYQQYNGYTGTSLYESTSLTVFNTLFTSLCVIFLGIFEKDLEAPTLLAIPELYSYGQLAEGFNFRKYFAWTFMAVVEAMIVYWTMYTLYGIDIISPDGSLYAIGDLCFTAGVIIINTKILLIEMHSKTYMSWSGWGISIFGWFIWNILLSSVLPANLQYPVLDSFTHTFGDSLIWWVVLLSILSSFMIFEIGVSSVRRRFWPTDIEMFQELEKDPAVMNKFKDLMHVTDGNKTEGDGDGDGEIDLLSNDGQGLLTGPGSTSALPLGPKSPRSPQSPHIDSSSIAAAVNRRSQSFVASPTSPRVGAGSSLGLKHRQTSVDIEAGLQTP